MTFLHILYYLLVFVQLVSGIVLTYVVTIQESKSEGLTSQIGSTVTSSFKGKAGRDEMLNGLTRRVAVVFFAVSLVVAVATGRWNV